MRPYEVAVIFDASLEDSIIRETTDQILEFVRARGGTPGRVDRWGRRTFAYEVNHKTEGYYLFIEVVGEPSVLSELDRMLTLSDDVIRHRVIRQPDQVGGRQTVLVGAAEPGVSDAPSEKSGGSDAA